MKEQSQNGRWDRAARGKRTWEREVVAGLPPVPTLGGPRHLRTSNKASLWVWGLSPTGRDPKVLAPPRSSWDLVPGVSDFKFTPRSFPIFHDRSTGMREMGVGGWRGRGKGNRSEQRQGDKELREQGGQR